MVSPLPEGHYAQAEYKESQAFEPVHLKVVQNDSETQKVLQILRRVVPNLDLSNLQLELLLQSWQGKTYGQMADSLNYDPDYLKDVGHKLWRKLSDDLGQTISKQNFSAVLAEHYQQFKDSNIAPLSPPSQGSDSSPSLNQMELIESPKPICDWGEAPDISIFIGHSLELEQLQQWIVKEHHRLVGLFGLGGVGKTALAVKCVEQVREQFDYVIWRSLRNQPNFNEFITGLLQCLTGVVTIELPDSPEEKITLLLQQLNRHRCLLVIDDWFTVLQRNTHAGLHQDNHDYYGLLLRRVSEGRHQSCVLITSREKPVGLVFKDTQTLPVRALRLNGLNGEAGREILRAFGLSATDSILDRLIECYSGNPYALRTAVATIIDLFSGQISKFLEQEQLIYGDIHRLIEQQIQSFI